MVNAVFFPPVSGTTNKWRIIIKANSTAFTNSNALTAEIVFKYIDNDASFNLLNNNMTLFHFGTSSTSQGFAIVLRKILVNSSPQIQLGLRTAQGNGFWADAPGSFNNLNLYGNVSTDGFYIFLTYHLFGTGSNQYMRLKYTGVKYNEIPTIGTRFNYDSSFNIGKTQQIGIGSSPENIADPSGNITSNSYNSYVSQNISFEHLRLWSTDLSNNSTTTGTYAMFNSDLSFSLYDINRSNNPYVPINSSNLQFQLLIPSTSNPALGDLSNNAITPITTVSTTYQAQNATSGLPHFYINANDDVNTGGIIISTSNITCLLRGTRILTPDGYRLIEDLKIGDTVLTHDMRSVIIKDIKITSVYGNEKTYPHIIRKNTHGAFNDLYLSLGHAVLIDDTFIHAYKLDLPMKKRNELYEYYSIRLENYLTDTLVANGVPVETWAGWEHGQEYPKELEKFFDENNNRKILKLDDPNLIIW